MFTIKIILKTDVHNMWVEADRIYSELNALYTNGILKLTTTLGSVCFETKAEYRQTKGRELVLYLKHKYPDLYNMGYVEVVY